MRLKPIKGLAVAIAILATVSSGVHAEVNEVRLSRGLSLGFLPSIVMQDQKLVEKHAKASGLNDLKVVWQGFIGGVAMNDALISGQMHFAGGGPPPFTVLWARTQGTPHAVKAIAALNASPMYLLTRNPAVKSVRDFGPKDRIAVPGAKISNQAVVLQMVAEKVFGDRGRFDPLTVVLSLPDGFTALLSGGELTAQFSGPPFQYQTKELQKRGVRKILDSEEVLGGPTTFLMMWTTNRFYEENPKIYQAVYAALEEAINLINRDHRLAAGIFLRVTKQKAEPAEIVRILDDPGTKYGLAPQNIMKYVDFLHKSGVIKTRPASWKDMFFPGPVHNLPGS